MSAENNNSGVVWFIALAAAVAVFWLWLRRNDQAGAMNISTTQISKPTLNTGGGGLMGGGMPFGLL